LLEDKSAACSQMIDFTAYTVPGLVLLFNVLVLLDQFWRTWYWKP